MSQKAVARDTKVHNETKKTASYNGAHSLRTALSLSEISWNIVCTPASAAASTWDFEF